MIRIISFIVLVLVIALGFSWLAEHPGDVSIIWQGYQIETSVIVALVAMIALSLVISLIWVVVRFVLGVPAVISLSSRARKRARGLAAVSRGLIAVGTGDMTTAQRSAAEAERLLGKEPLALLLKAQTAQMVGDREEAENTFHLMFDAPETQVLALRGLFVEARRKGDQVAARAYAQTANKLAPQVNWSSEALLEYQSIDRNWDGALATLERQKSRKLIGREAARRLQAVLLTASALERQESDPDEALRQARAAVKLAPSLVPAAALAGRLLSREGSLRKAAKILEAAWKIAPHPDIAAAYVDLRPGDSARDRFLRAKTLERLAPSHPEAHFIMALSAFEAQDFSAARAALAPLLKNGPTVRTCLLMADIAEAEHGANGEWREWIGRASRARRDPTWIADGIVSQTWQPVSPVTGQLDAFVWAAPMEQIGAFVIEEETLPTNALLVETSPIAHTIERSAVSVSKPKVEFKRSGAASINEEVLPTPDAIEKKEEQSAKVKDVVFPLDHAPDDPGPNASQDVIDEPVRRSPGEIEH